MGRRDDAAVRAIYRAHVDRVHRHVARVLGSSDPDVDDVVQQVFWAAIEGADAFDGRSSVSTWLIGIAIRRALDHARGRHRRARWGKVLELVGLGQAPAQPDVAHRSRSDAERALATLGPDVRTAFVLYEVEGYTLAEIASMTGTGISTLHARLKVARRALDGWVEQHGSDAEGGDHGDAA